VIQYLFFSLTISCFAFQLGSCGNSKTQAEPKGLDVVLKFQKHEPYCGGAYPTPDQERGWISPISNQQYAIYKTQNDSVKHTQKAKALGVFTTNELGIIETKLAPGYYYAVMFDKTMPFEKFYEKYEIVSDQFRQSAGRACFEEWYETPELRFQVVEKGANKFEVTLQSYCFTGLLRCVGWVGPLPPSVGR
jgi:hypothetical protein